MSATGTARAGNSATTSTVSEFRRSDKEELVRRFLKQERWHAWEGAAGLLIVVYRLRNNLFHGPEMGLRHSRPARELRERERSADEGGRFGKLRAELDVISLGCPGRSSQCRRRFPVLPDCGRLGTLISPVPFRAGRTDKPKSRVQGRCSPRVDRSSLNCGEVQLRNASAVRRGGLRQCQKKHFITIL